MERSGRDVTFFANLQRSGLGRQGRVRAHRGALVLFFKGAQGERLTRRHGPDKAKLQPHHVSTATRQINNVLEFRKSLMCRLRVQCDDVIVVRLNKALKTK